MSTVLTFILALLHVSAGFGNGNEESLKYLQSLTPLEVAEIVKNEFVFAYTAYKQYAWGCDELLPISKKCKNVYNQSLMWTPIDALDTMYLMNLTDLLNDTLNLLCSTPFNNNTHFTFRTNQDVFVFDYFLRSLGGLLSGYYFTNSECLQNLALELSDLIYPIFNEVTPSQSGLPWLYINPYTQIVNTQDQRTGPAIAGTNILEYGLISLLTNNLKYWNSSMNILQILYNAKSPTLGLIGNGIALNTTSDMHSTTFFYSNKSMIDGGIDSYYEYILKCAILFQNLECADMWYTINKSVINNLGYYTNELLWFRRADMFTGVNTPDWYLYDLYSCFYSGVLSLSTTLNPHDINNKYNLNLAQQNQEANWFMWLNNQSNIEPFVYNFAYAEDDATSYDLNPENFESNYYLYMITNNSLYYNRSLIYLNDLMTYCKCDGIECVGYAGLQNVNDKTKSDSLPSFFFAESLKYLYLTFMRNEQSNPLPFAEFVFNTEAHPFPKSWGRKLNDMIKTKK